jgi:hypothetical protein
MRRYVTYVSGNRMKQMERARQAKTRRNGDCGTERSQ